jgi:hypothetical protein
MSDPAIHYARKWQFASTAQPALGLAMVGATLFASRHNEQIDLLRFPLAWSGVLMLLDGLVRVRHGRSPLATPADWAWSLAASIAFWDVFELVNLRLHNWWYTAVPRTLLGDVAFSAVSFATVLPAVQLGDALLRPRNESRPLPVGRSGPAGDGLLGSAAFLVALGVASLALPLAFPRACFGLAWLFVFPLAEAALLLAGPRPLHALASPLEAWRSGDRTLAYRLLAFGIPLGFVWEGLNWVLREAGSTPCPASSRTSCSRCHCSGSLAIRSSSWKQARC